MRIIHRIDDFLHTIFPNIQDESQMIKVLENYYSYGSHKPKVKIENGFVIVDVDIISITSQEIDFKKAISFCEKSFYIDIPQPHLFHLSLRELHLSDVGTGTTIRLMHFCQHC